VAELLSVPEAAQRLHVDASRVRQLIRRGDLRAMRVGGRWVLPSDAVDARAEEIRRSGRPLSPRIAWGLLIEASGRRAEWLDRFERSRVRRRLQSLQHPRPSEVTWLLRRRSNVHSFYAHPSAAERLLAEPGIVLAGVSAAHEVGADIVAGNLLEFYASEDGIDRLVKRYRLRVSDNANVIIKVPVGLWPFADDDRVAPAAAIAVDLIDAKDERSLRAGSELLTRTLRTWHNHFV
jgi:excisionase family DNA binding protein